MFESVRQIGDLLIERYLIGMGYHDLISDKKNIRLLGYPEVKDGFVKFQTGEELNPFSENHNHLLHIGHKSMPCSWLTMTIEELKNDYAERVRIKKEDDMSLNKVRLSQMVEIGAIRKPSLGEDMFLLSGGSYTDGKNLYLLDEAEFNSILQRAREYACSIEWV